MAMPPMACVNPRGSSPGQGRGVAGGVDSGAPGGSLPPLGGSGLVGVMGGTGWEAARRGWVPSHLFHQGHVLSHPVGQGWCLLARGAMAVIDGDRSLAKGSPRLQATPLVFPSEKTRCRHAHRLHRGGPSRRPPGRPSAAPWPHGGGGRQRPRLRQRAEGPGPQPPAAGGRAQGGCVAVPELVFLATPNEANVAVVNAVAATKGITSYWSAMNGFVKSITIKPKVHPSATGAAASALCL